jgi:hypothetical protein
MFLAVVFILANGKTRRSALNWRLRLTSLFFLIEFVYDSVIFCTVKFFDSSGAFGHDA